MKNPHTIQPNQQSQNPISKNIQQIYKSTRILTSSIIAFDRLYSAYKLPDPSIKNSNGETYPVMLNRILMEYNRKLKEFTNIFITRKFIPEYEKFQTQNNSRFSSKLSKVFEEICYRYNELFSSRITDYEKLKKDLGDLGILLGVKKRKKEEPNLGNIPRVEVKTNNKKGGLMSIAESVIENNIVFDSMDFNLHPPGPLDVNRFRKGVELRKSEYISKSNEKKRGKSSKKHQRGKPSIGDDGGLRNYGVPPPPPNGYNCYNNGNNGMNDQTFDYVNMRKAKSQRKMQRQKSGENLTLQDVGPLDGQRGDRRGRRDQQQQFYSPDMGGKRRGGNENNNVNKNLFYQSQAAFYQQQQQLQNFQQGYQNFNSNQKKNNNLPPQQQNHQQQIPNINFLGSLNFDQPPQQIPPPAGGPNKQQSIQDWVVIPNTQNSSNSNSPPYFTQSKNLVPPNNSFNLAYNARY